MTSTSERLRRQLPVALLLLFLLILGSSTGVFRSLESASYSIGMEFSATRRASERFAVIMLDDATRQTMGDWPWSGPDMARLLDALEREGVRGVVWNMPLVDPVTPETVMALDAVESFLPEASEAGISMADLRNRVMPNSAIAEAFGDTQRIVLGIPSARLADKATASELTRWRLDYVSAATRPSSLPGDLVPPAAPWADMVKNWRAAPRPLPFEPAEIPSVLLDAVDGVGLVPALQEYAAYPVVLGVEDQWLPSLPLRMAMLATEARGGSVWLRAGEGLALGDHWIATDSDGRAHPYFYPQEGSAALRRHSMADLLASAMPEDALLGRVVILSTDAAATVSTPLHEKLPEGVALGQVAASLYSGDVYSSPWWVTPARLSAWVMVIIWLLLLLPRMNWRWSALGSVVLAAILFNVELVLLISQSWWLPLAAPVSVLVVGHAVLQLQLWRTEVHERHREQLSESNFELGKERRSHGQLDAAFHAFRRCLASDVLLDQLNDLAHDYERRQHFAKALKVFRHVKKVAPSTPEVDQRINRLQRLEEQSLRHRDHPIALEPGETRDPRSAPMIGRFSILEEIGRGSMAVVYRGTDSRIGRDVAVKTLSLRSEFSGENLEEAQTRFFREAEAAGRLSHPNIVTIYDVGEEEGLAYIAMDFLSGPSLAKFTKPETLLDVSQVLRLAANVADALNAAHEQNVIHRDVKPANIVMTHDETEVKVTDFGVAHLVDASQTKTGTILGSPSFMSPEQVSGKRLDGRSDLWSLGVAIYQLLTGHLPFTGEPLGTLMYRIANEAPVPAIDWRPDLPDCAISILDRALQKDPDKRYQTGRGMAGALRQCLKKLGDGIEVDK